MEKKKLTYLGTRLTRGYVEDKAADAELARLAREREVSAGCSYHEALLAVCKENPHLYKRRLDDKTIDVREYVNKEGIIAEARGTFLLKILRLAPDAVIGLHKILSEGPSANQIQTWVNQWNLNVSDKVREAEKEDWILKHIRDGARSIGTSLWSLDPEYPRWPVYIGKSPFVHQLNDGTVITGPTTAVMAKKLAKEGWTLAPAMRDEYFDWAIRFQIGGEDRKKLLEDAKRTDGATYDESSLNKAINRVLSLVGIRSRK